MGLFGGSSKSKTNVSTKTITETETNIRDIGLTGAHAVELADSIGSTNVGLATLSNANFAIAAQAGTDAFREVASIAKQQTAGAQTVSLRAAETQGQALQALASRDVQAAGGIPPMLQVGLVAAGLFIALRA